jgi:hypothetical protein
VIATNKSKILIWTPDKSQAITLTTEDPVSLLHIASIGGRVFIFAATTGGELIYSIASEFTPIQLRSPEIPSISLFQIGDTVLFANELFVNLIEFDKLGVASTSRQISSPYVVKMLTSSHPITCCGIYITSNEQIPTFHITCNNLVTVYTIEDFGELGGVYQVALSTGIKEIWSSKMGRIFANMLAQSWRVYTVVCSESTYVGNGPNYIGNEVEKVDVQVEGQAERRASAVHAAKQALEERGEKLEALGEDSTKLADGSSAFLKAAREMNKKKSWWMF